MESGTLGVLAGALEARGLRADTRDAWRGAPVPGDDGGHHGLIVLGGTMGALDDEAHPHLARTAGLIGRFHARGKPVLGVCLGAQLIARAMGARVWRRDVPELGFFPLALSEAAAADPLLDGLASPQWIMQWHDDTFDLPRGARLLMSGEACPNQAYRMGAASYGFQGHFEVTRAMVERWLAETADQAHDPHHADFRRRIGGELARHLDAQRVFCQTVGTRWADLVAARRGA